VKWAQNQSLGEKWAATSKRLRSTALNDQMNSKRSVNLQTTILQKFLKNKKSDAYNNKIAFKIKFVAWTSNIKKYLKTSNLML